MRVLTLEEMNLIAGGSGCRPRRTYSSTSCNPRPSNCGGTSTPTCTVSVTVTVTSSEA